jgi:hypothetical protein
VHPSSTELGLLLTVDWEERDRCVGGVGEVAFIEGGECDMCHLLDGIVDLGHDDGSLPRCSGVNGYLHPDLKTFRSWA